MKPSKAPFFYLLFGGLIFLYHQALAQTPVTKKIGDNVFEISSAHNDTFIIVDPVSSASLMRVNKPQLLKLNGDIIYSKEDVTKQPKYIGDEEHLHTYLFNKLKGELNKLLDGIYFFSINDVVISKEGKLVYFVYGGLHKAATFNNKAVSTELGLNKHIASSSESTIIIGDDDNDQSVMMDIINEKAKAILNNVIIFKPAEIDNKPVHFKTMMFAADNTIQVRQHVSSFSATDDAL